VKFLLSKLTTCKTVLTHEDVVTLFRFLAKYPSFFERCEEEGTYSVPIVSEDEHIPYPLDLKRQVTVVSTLQECITAVKHLQTHHELFCDTEFYQCDGRNLSCGFGADHALNPVGTNLSHVAVIQIATETHAYIFDVFPKRKLDMFSSLYSFRTLFETSEIRKWFFDSRNDAAFLQQCTGIEMACFTDLQALWMRIFRELIGFSNHCIIAARPALNVLLKLLNLPKHHFKVMVNWKDGRTRRYFLRNNDFSSNDGMRKLQYCALDVLVLSHILRKLNWITNILSTERNVEILYDE
jgi:hypothetical protein